MNISIKVKASIQSRLERVKDDSFQEDDIKMLLIDIREYIREESLLRELADFIAHPTRDKGIFNKTLNVRYFKLKLINEQHKKLDAEQQKKIKTERQLSDFLLDGININKVEKKLFDVLFIDGLSDIDDKLFRDHYPLAKKQVQKLVSESYQLDSTKRFYELKNIKLYTVIENALRFIRGTIQAKAVFSQQAFEKEVQRAISRIVNELNLDKSYLAAVKRNIKSILLCILCLLHDCKFVFHDNHIGTCFLSFYPADSQSIGDNVNGESFIALISDDISVRMPIFISNIKVSEHILTSENEIDKQRHMERIPWINASRNKDKKLILTT